MAVANQDFLFSIWEHVFSVALGFVLWNWGYGFFRVLAFLLVYGKAFIVTILLINPFFIITAYFSSRFLNF